jgi:hypothetical protein
MTTERLPDAVTSQQPPSGQPTPPPITVTLDRTTEPWTPDVTLWAVIKDRAEAVQFRFYKDYMDSVLLPGLAQVERQSGRRGDYGAIERLVDRVNAYDVLKTATELYLMAECGLVPSQPAMDAVAKLEDQIEPKAAGNRSRARSSSRSATSQANRHPGASIKQRDDADLRNLRAQYLERLRGGVQITPYMNLILERLEDRPLKPDWAVDGAAEYGILRDRVSNPPMVELLWSYWHEEGMLVQSFAAIARRFQNQRVVSGHDPLVNLNIDPLRGANNLIWGWIQDEPNRLTVPRRAYEYDHQYGLSLVGRAVPNIEAADSRPKFLRAFHELLHLCVKFYEQDDDTTVVADPFPILNALKEVHMILAEGAHNQFGDLPWTARVHMMIMQWILSRPEFREFLGARIMVPYEEEWMDRVDAVRHQYGWGDTSVMHFRDLAVYGEQILLSIRYGNWMTNAITPQGANWARAWREEIQIYIHAYRTVTGVDLTAEPVDQRAAEARDRQPSFFLREQEVHRQRMLARKSAQTRA